ncbi:MAG TPA: recombinase family protein, partial [Caldisericia bacterium]|nr:recombinase family protein [Caldisericia bacterium]
MTINNQRAIGYIRVSSDDQAREGLSLEAQERKIRAYCDLKGLELVTIFKDEGISGFKPLEKRPGGLSALASLGFVLQSLTSHNGNGKNSKLSLENDLQKVPKFERSGTPEGNEWQKSGNALKTAQDYGILEANKCAIANDVSQSKNGTVYSCPDGPVACNLVAIKLDRLFRNTGDAISKSQEFQKRGINLHLLDVSVDTSTATGKMFFTVLAMLAQFERDITGERTKTVLDMKRKDGKVWNHTPFGYDRVGDVLIP